MGRGGKPLPAEAWLRLEEAVDGGESSPDGSYRLERGGDRRVAGEGLAIYVATLTLPPRLLTEDFFYHGVACGPSRLTLYAAFYCGLAVLQGLHGLELPGRRGEDRESGEGA